MKRRGRKRAEGGAAAVEMALVLPILFLLVFGIIEFGFVFNRWISVTHAAREGVRLLSIGESQLDSETKAEQSAPDLGSSVSCTGSYPSPDDVQMRCDTTYTLQLFIFDEDVDLHSTALMRKE
jgi:hypothetical protein